MYKNSSLVLVGVKVQTQQVWLGSLKCLRRMAQDNHSGRRQERNTRPSAGVLLKTNNVRDREVRIFIYLRSDTSEVRLGFVRLGWVGLGYYAIYNTYIC